MTFTQEQLQIIDSIKYHIVTEAEKRGQDMPDGVTDKVALDYALGVTDLFIKKQYELPAHDNKSKLKKFLSKK